jgi:hypothetical protein
MHRLFVTFTPLACAALLLLACERPADPAPSPAPQPANSAPASSGAASPTTEIPGGAAPSPADPDPDCNLATPLVPGIPGSPGNLIVSARNPNGDSELAALMRDCVDDLVAARQALEKGLPPVPMRDTHRRMRCSWHTKDETRNETFDGLARSYLASVASFDAKPAQEQFNGIVQSCVACHSVFCGGPLDLIEQLYWR